MQKRMSLTRIITEKDSMLKVRMIKEQLRVHNHYGFCICSDIRIFIFVTQKQLSSQAFQKKKFGRDKK